MGKTLARAFTRAARGAVACPHAGGRARACPAIGPSSGSGGHQAGHRYAPPSQRRQRRGIPGDLAGTGVTQLASQNGWYTIRTADNYTGWVLANAVIGIHKTTYTPDAKTVQVAELSANVYRDPERNTARSGSAATLGSAARTHPTKPAKTGRWIHVTAGRRQHRMGAARRHQRRIPFPLTIRTIIDLARRFLGITYTWGGVSSFGFDCSGFTQMLVRQRGIEMPRDAGLQADWSGVVPVKRAELQPGRSVLLRLQPGKESLTPECNIGERQIHSRHHPRSSRGQISVLGRSCPGPDAGGRKESTIMIRRRDLVQVRGSVQPVGSRPPTRGPRRNEGACRILLHVPLRAQSGFMLRHTWTTPSCPQATYRDTVHVPYSARRRYRLWRRRSHYSL